MLLPFARTPAGCSRYCSRRATPGCISWGGNFQCISWELTFSEVDPCCERADAHAANGWDKSQSKIKGIIGWITMSVLTLVLQFRLVGCFWWLKHNHQRTGFTFLQDCSRLRPVPQRTGFPCPWWNDRWKFCEMEATSRSHISALPDATPRRRWNGSSCRD